MRSFRILGPARGIALGLIAAVASVAAAPETVAAHDAGDGIACFDSGSWWVNDGGNAYLGKTTQDCVVKVENCGPGRVTVRFVNDWGRSFSVQLPPGATLRQTMKAGWHVEVIDGGRDGLGANGKYDVP